VPIEKHLVQCSIARESVNSSKALQATSIAPYGICWRTREILTL
jgi:hypothetical protein